MENIEISSCAECPNLRKTLMYTMDGWDSGCDWLCNNMNSRRIAVFVEWRDEPKIPDWCPMSIEKK
jgi:hypothetical protein